MKLCDCVLCPVLKASARLLGVKRFPLIKHRHAKRARVIFCVVGAFVALFTVMIWLSFFGCDVQQERNWEFIMHIRCYIGNGKIAK